jgi:hypothetical protein
LISLAHYLRYVPPSVTQDDFGSTWLYDLYKHEIKAQTLEETHMVLQELRDIPNLSIYNHPCIVL